MRGEQQAERSLLTLFPPGTSRAVELCGCADAKCPLDRVFGQFMLLVHNFRVEAAWVLLKKSAQSTNICFQEKAAVFRTAEGCQWLFQFQASLG